MTRHWSPYYQHIMRLTDHRVAELKRQLSPNTSPHYLTEQIETQQLGDTCMTCGTTWKTEQARPDKSMDHGGVPRCASTAIEPNMASTVTSEPKITDGLHPKYV